MSMSFVSARSSWPYPVQDSISFPDRGQSFTRTNVKYLNQSKDIQVIKTNIRENIASRPDVNHRSISEHLHWFLKKNNQTLSSLVIFLENFATSIWMDSQRLHWKPSALFKSVYSELKNVDKLQVGNFSVSDGKLRVRHVSNIYMDAFRGCQFQIVELLFYVCEIEMILDNKLPEEDPLRKVMQLEGQAKEGMFSKLLSGLKKDSKKDRTPEPNAVNTSRQNSMEMAEMSRPAYNITNLPNITDHVSIENIRQREMLVVQYMRRNRYLMGKYADKPRTMEFTPPDYRKEVNVVDILRDKFRNEDLDGKIVSAALSESLGCPDKAATWIREKRQNAKKLLARFPDISDQRKHEIADSCLYDEKFMYILASEEVLNAIPPKEIQTTEQILQNEEIDHDKRVRIGAFEFFAHCYDRINRASTLLQILSYKDPNKRPKECGWWSDYDNFTFQHFLSAVNSLQEVTQSEVISCSIMNNECGVCGAFYHRDNIFEMECQCIFCYDCVMNNLSYACGGNIETALGCLNGNCPNAGRVEAMDEETKNNAFFIKYQSLVEIGKTKPEYLSTVNKFVELFRKYMTKRMPHFTPCAHCESGQVQADLTNKKMTCHNCSKHTCHSCKYQWFDEHKELSCSKYKIWLSKNHPDILGLTEAALAGSFIECPECHETYMLQRGGCLHFECKRCPAEFCGFCYQTFFTKKNPCKSCEPAKQTMLHAHCPRNCFSFLRDQSCEWLIDLLETRKVEWKPELADHKSEEGLCTVKETNDLGEESLCGRAVYQGQELCEKHLKEFLSLIIFQKRVDPIYKYDVHEISVLARRENLDMPKDLPIEELREAIIEMCPLMNDEDEEDE